MNDTDTVPGRYPSALPIYKPNARGTGGVVRFSLNAAKEALFVEAAAQSDERQFNWEEKIIMKWGLADIGAVLAVLQGRQDQAKLFHQTQSANSSLELSHRDDPEKAPYLLAVSRQESADKSLRKVVIPVSHAEAALLASALHTAVARILDW